MTGFAFRLQRVARVRQVERDRARADWAHARAEEARVQLRLQQLRDHAAAEPGLQVGVVQATSDIRAAAFRASLRAQAAESAVVDLTAAGAVREAAAHTLLLAARAADALERLEERQRDAWATEVRRAEVAVLDDLATTAAARRGRVRR